MHGEVRNVFNILAENLKGRRQFGDIRRREDNIKMELKGLNSNHLPKDTDQCWNIANKVMNYRVPLKTKPSADE
jgi:hypothetical protein